MKLEPDTSIASFPLKKPLWCYIEDKRSEHAIQVRGSPTDCLTPAVSTNTLWLRSDSLWVFAEAKSNHRRGKTHPAAPISEGVFLFSPPPQIYAQTVQTASNVCTHRWHIYICNFIREEPCPTSCMIWLRCGSVLAGNFNSPIKMMAGWNLRTRKRHIYILHTSP